MAYNDFLHENKLKTKATSNIKIQQILPSSSFKDVKLCLKDGPFTIDVGFVNLHPIKGKHWVAYTKQNYTGILDLAPPHKPSRFLT